MARLPGIPCPPEVAARISASMKSRMAVKFPLENRRGAVPKRKGPKPFTEAERVLAKERKTLNDRMRRKSSWYSEYRRAA